MDIVMAGCLIVASWLLGSIAGGLVVAWFYERAIKQIDDEIFISELKTIKQTENE